MNIEKRVNEALTMTLEWIGKWEEEAHKPSTIRLVTTDKYLDLMARFEVAKRFQEMHQLQDEVVLPGACFASGVFYIEKAVGPGARPEDQAVARAWLVLLVVLGKWPCAEGAW